MFMQYIKRLLGFFGIFILISYLGLPLLGASISFGQPLSDDWVVDDLNDGLVAYYPFSGNANDESGNGNNGSVYGAVLTQDRFGRVNSAYHFDGIDDYIDLGTSNSLKMADAVTISAWIKMESFTPRYQNIISDHGPNEIYVGCGKILRFEYSTVQFHVGGIHGFGTSIYVKKTFDAEVLNQWLHIVGTYDRNTLRLFINGSQVDTRSYSKPLSVTPNPVLIGKSGFEDCLQGIIDDLRIYNRALSKAEILQLYNLSTFEIIQKVDKSFVWHGAEVTYTTTYRNTGDADASNVVIEITLPSTLELINGSISNGGTYNSTNRRISWNVGSLQAGSEAQTVTFKAKVASGIADGTNIVLTAQISSAEKPEPITSSVTTTVALPKITSISPDKGGNTGSVTVTINGQYLDPHAAIKLSKTGQTDIIASIVTGTSQGTQLEATFNLTDKTPGTWDLVVNNPGGGSSTLSNAFTIESGGAPKLWVEIVGREQIRVGRPTEYLYRYGNAGNVDVEMGFLDLELPEDFICVSVKDGNQNVIWAQETNSEEPLTFVIAPLSPGEIRELRVTIIATRAAAQFSSDKSKPNDFVVAPFLVFLGKTLLQSAIEDFAQKLFEHKWDEYGTLNVSGIEIYIQDWATAFKEASKDFFSQNFLIFSVKSWFSGGTDKTIKILEKIGKKTAASHLKFLKLAILDIPGWATAIKKNLDKNPYLKKLAALIKKLVTPVISWDPNDKAGPTGNDPDGTSAQLQKHFITTDHSFPYMVQFENLETATAAVQDMKISDQLDSNLDWSTFSFDTIQIGTHTISVPQGSQRFSTSVDFRPEMQVIVDVECTFNSSSGLAQWIFRGKDPNTGELADFLPPNTENIDPKGRGWVLYNVKPKANLATGTVIKNKATIDFEIDIPPAPMNTPEWINTIDITKPESHVLALSPTQNSASFTVQWQGTDKHSGIQSYSIYVSDNGSSYVEWLSNTTETSAAFTGLYGHSYAFYSIAKDNTGNQEDIPAAPDTTTTVSGSSTVVINLNRTALNFGAASGSVVTQPQNVLISSPVGGILNWTAVPNQNWLQVSPTSGTGNSIMIVSVGASGLSPGTYNGSITVTDPNASNSPQTIDVTLNVYKSGITSKPFGEFATPINGSTVRSSIPVTGWVLDDIGAESVKIYRKEGKSLVYIGDAVLVEGARPDVEQAYPDYPQNYKAGWGYMMLTNFLPNGGNGIFNIHAIAADTEGHEVTLGVKTITCDNANAVKPFGAIDTPTQGGTTSGSNFINWGWVLTPQPNSIPTDGSTITVYVDGVNLGHPTYNVYRKDIATLFPGYVNSNGAVGYFYLDTTSYENGVHAIQWTAADDAGNTDGIGSRYFTIQNTGASGQRSLVNAHWSLDNKRLSSIPFDYFEPVKIKKGYNRNVEPEKIYPDDKGMITIEIRELERVEINLNNNRAEVEVKAKVEEDNSDNSNFYSGYLVVGNQLRPLPVGSTLDVERGVFYWQPGPGFIGDYRFVFVGKIQDGEMNLKNINVKIGPR